MDLHSSYSFLIDLYSCYFVLYHFPYPLCKTICCSEAAPNLPETTVEMVIPEMYIKYVYGEDSSNLHHIKRVGQFALGNSVSLIGNVS